jgi:hypothetical protein
MTKKFDEFVVELESLCKKHGVVLSVSGYDSLQVWDLKDYHKGEVVSSCGIEDMTEDHVCLDGGDL